MRPGRPYASAGVGAVNNQRGSAGGPPCCWGAGAVPRALPYLSEPTLCGAGQRTAFPRWERPLWGWVNPEVTNEQLGSHKEVTDKELSGPSRRPGL